MSGISASAFEAYFSFWEFEFVVKHDDLREGYFVKPHERSDGRTGSIDICLGFEGEDFFISMPSVCTKSAEMGAPFREFQCLPEGVEGTKADIVRCVGEARTGISQSHQKLHEIL